MTIWLLVHCLLELVSNWNKSFRAENSFSLRQSHASGVPGSEEQQKKQAPLEAGRPRLEFWLSLPGEVT